MNFLIIVPKYNKDYFYYDFPVGLAYIAAAIKQAGYNVKCLNLNHHNIENQASLIKDAIEKWNINIVCTGGLVVHFNSILQILVTAKQTRPNIITIVGGGLISCEPELIFKALPVDIGVLGEGDKTIQEIADALANQKSFENIKGIIYRKTDGTQTITEPRDSISDLSELAYPDYEGLGLDFYLDNLLPYDTTNFHVLDKPRIMPVISSRSCPYQCRFCYHPIGNKYRSRPLDDFFNEIEFLIERYNVNGLLIIDELLCHSKERLKAICQRLKGYNLKWMAQLRVDSVNEELLQMMKDAGCFNISYGIESAHNDILKSMKKNTTLDQIENALDLTYKTGISLQGNLLFSDRSETSETIEHSINWALNNWHHRIQLTPLFALPNSSDYQYAVEKGLITDKLKFIRHGCGAVNITEIPDDEMNLLYRTISCFSHHLLIIPEKYTVEKTGYDHYRHSPLYSLTFECPHCKKMCCYDNICIYGAVINNRYIHCKHCRGRSDILIDWFEHYQNAVDLERDRPYLETINESRNSYEALAIKYKNKVNLSRLGEYKPGYTTINFHADSNKTAAIVMPLTDPYRQIAITIGKQLKNNNVNARIFEIPGIEKDKLAKCDKSLLQFFYQKENISEVISINATRSELAIPDNIKYYRILHDTNENDNSANTVNLADLNNWPSSLPPATNFKQYNTSPTAETVQHIDIAVTFNNIEPEPPYSDQTKAVLAPFIEEIKRELNRTNDFSCTMENAQYLLDIAEKKLNKHLTGTRELIYDYIEKYTIKSVMQYELIRKIRYLSQKHKWNFVIAGKYWENIDQFQNYIHPFKGYYNEMANFVKQCKVIVHVDGFNNCSLLDLLACGTFCVVKEDKEQMSKTMNYFDTKTVPRFNDTKELENILKHHLIEAPAERIAAAERSSDIIDQYFCCSTITNKIVAG